VDVCLLAGVAQVIASAKAAKKAEARQKAAAVAVTALVVCPDGKLKWKEAPQLPAAGDASSSADARATGPRDHLRKFLVVSLANI
jgi:hypothetical protein